MDEDFREIIKLKKELDALEDLKLYCISCYGKHNMPLFKLELAISEAKCDLDQYLVHKLEGEYNVNERQY